MFRSGVLGLAVAGFIFAAGNVFAVPALQLYIPDASYDHADQTWLSSENDFDLWAVGASRNGNIDRIESVKLFVALRADDLSGFSQLSDPLINVAGFDNALNSSLYYGNFMNDPVTPAGLSPHGIYGGDVYYAILDLPVLQVSSAGETVNDYNPNGGGTDTGDIQRYSISLNEDVSWVHFDLTGTAYSGAKGKHVFAPYSHDAGASPVPEPATMALLGAGLLGLARIRKRS